MRSPATTTTCASLRCQPVGHILTEIAREPAVSVAQMRRRHRLRKNLMNAPMGLLLIIAAPFIAIAFLVMWIAGAVEAWFRSPREQ